MRRIILLFALFTAVAAMAQTEVRFKNEGADTLRITELLDVASKMRFADPEARVAFFAQQFTGTPYVAGTLEEQPEILTVNLEGMDCTTFVETALALAYTLGENRTSWRDYVYNLRRMRYRGGVVDGYPSRLHYVADWAVDNIHRGNLRDVTRDFPRFAEFARTLDFMSSNREKYPALADSANFARIRSLENGYRMHRFPYVKSIDLGNKQIKATFHTGDVVALVANMKNLDVTHMGIIIKDDKGEPFLLHASSKGKKVEMTALPLYDFMKKNRNWAGVRVFRLTQ